MQQRYFPRADLKLLWTRHQSYYRNASSFRGMPTSSLQAMSEKEARELHLKAFDRWVHDLHHNSSVGMVTYRMWCASREQDVIEKLPWYSDGQEKCLKSVGPDLQSEIKHNMSNFEQPFAGTNCWARQEHLHSDLVRCLCIFDAIEPGLFQKG